MLEKDKAKELTTVDSLLNEREKEFYLFSTAQNLLNSGQEENDFSKMHRAKLIFAYLQNRYEKEKYTKFAGKIDQYFTKKKGTYLKTARMYLKNGNKYLAAVYYKRLLAADPENTEAHVFLEENKNYLDYEINKFNRIGKNKIEKKKHGEAKKYFQWVLWFDQDNSEAQRGLITIQKWKHSQAKKYFDLGKSLYHEGKYEKASDAFHKSKELGYSHSKISNFLTSIDKHQTTLELEKIFVEQARKRQYHQAISTYQKLPPKSIRKRKIAQHKRELDQDLRNYLKKTYVHAVQLYARKEFSQALENFQLLSSFNPNYREVKDYIVRCKAKLAVLETDKLEKNTQSSQPAGIDYLYESEKTSWELSGVKNEKKKKKTPGSQ